MMIFVAIVVIMAKELGDIGCVFGLWLATAFFILIATYLTGDLTYTVFTIPTVVFTLIILMMSRDEPAEAFSQEYDED